MGCGFFTIVIWCYILNSEESHYLPFLIFVFVIPSQFCWYLQIIDYICASILLENNSPQNGARPHQKMHLFMLSHHMIVDNEDDELIPCLHSVLEWGPALFVWVGNSFTTFRDCWFHFQLSLSVWDLFPLEVLFRTLGKNHHMCDHYMVHNRFIDSYCWIVILQIAIMNLNLVQSSDSNVILADRAGLPFPTILSLKGRYR